MAQGFGRLSAGAAAGLALAGCSWLPEPPRAAAPPPPPQPSFTADMLVGKWGLASYHKDADKARTEAAARGQCGNPYVIAKGPTGGAMMYLADQKEASELVVKAGSDGVTYIGPASVPPGDPLDRQVASFDKNEFVTLWVDPDAASRYGTMVFVRCGVKQ